MALGPPKVLLLVTEHILAETSGSSRGCYRRDQFLHGGWSFQARLALDSPRWLNSLSQELPRGGVWGTQPRAAVWTPTHGMPDAVLRPFAKLHELVLGGPVGFSE